MPVSSNSLSIDEFAVLVAAALTDIEVSGNSELGGNSPINCAVDGQERPQTPPTTNTSVKRLPFSSWRRKKPKFQPWSTSSTRFCVSTTDSFLDIPTSIKYSDAGSSTTSLLTIPYKKPLTTQMTTCTSEPTVLAASMSTVDLGNCLGLVGGSCPCPGTNSHSRHSASLMPSRNTAFNVPTMNTNDNTTPTVPIFTLEVEGDGSSPMGGPRPIDSEPNVIDLSSTLRLPRTLSPLFRKSAPDLRIQPPQGQFHPPESPRTPRKSFFSKLRKQLSSKTALDSHSNQSSPSTPVPTNSNNAHSDGSPTSFFKLHLALPLTPLSLSTSASPNTSRSPSPRFPFRALSGSYKRESAPPTTNAVVEKPSSPGQGSPTLSLTDGLPLSPRDEAKRRIYSLQDYSYASSHINQDSSPSRPVEEKLQGQSLDDEQHNRSNSILSLADCLVGGKTRTNWMRGEPKRLENRKPSSSSKEGGTKEPSGQSSQPFPIFTQRDSDDAFSEPSKYSCDSAPRSVGISFRTRQSKNGTSGETHGVISSPTGISFPGELESKPGRATVTQSPPQTSLPTSPDHRGSKAEAEAPSYAPFVPLVFQHERLQQKLQKSVPLASFEGLPAQDACIKSVPVRPFPPRSTSLFAASLHIRQRTKSAPNAFHNEKSSSSEHNLPVPPIPMLPTHLASVPTSVWSRPGSVAQTPVVPSKKSGKVERPTTAPANPSFKAQGVIPFPVAMEAEFVIEENADPERRRKSSKLKKMKLRKNTPSPLPSSVPTQPAESLSPLQSTGNPNEHSNAYTKFDTGIRTRSVGLDYSLSLSKHPYAQARSSEGPEEPAENAEAKPSVTFVPSTPDGESSQLQTRTQRHSKVDQNMTPSSPTSPTSGSGSGSEASTKSPITPRSPLFWTMGGSPAFASAVKSGIGSGIAGSSPMSGLEEGHNERRAYRDVRSDSIGTHVVRTSDGDGRMKKQYQPPHPYSRSYPTNPLTDEATTATDASPSKENPRNIPNSQSRSVNSQPSMQTHHGVMPSKLPPGGPLPFPPDTVEGKSGDGQSVGNNLLCEVPPSPVPSEYLKAFSSLPTRVRDDDDDSISNSHATLSYAPSQSSESYAHDPEYEALLAANTRANVGELASMRNIGVGRRLMSEYPQPSSRMDAMSSEVEGKRKRVHSEATRHPGAIGEWTLFLGNDGTPPRREDIIADLNSVPMTGIKTLGGVRTRTKSESALNALGFGNRSAWGMRRARSSTLAPSSSSPPPVPKLVKKKQVLKSEDWTLSLPLLPPGEGDPIKSTTEADLSETRRISDPLAATLVRDAKSPPLYPGREVAVCVDDEFNIDDADDMTVAEFVDDASFGLDIDSLDLEDEDDSLFDFPANSVPDRTPDVLSFNRLLFSVPRIVSKGSGIECATWGEEVDEKIMKRRGRRLSDGLHSLLGMAGVSVRVDVNEDGESVCVVDGLSLNTGEGSEEGLGIEGHESAGFGAYDAMEDNLARLDALSADLKRFNELLREGVSVTTAVDLKHARSCGLFPSQTEVKTEHLRVKQSLDALRDPDPSSKPTSAKDRAKSIDRSALNGPPVSSSPRPSSPPTGSMTRGRPPLPFAPSSPPNARPLSRGATLGIGPTAISPGGGRSVTGRAMTMTTKPSHVKFVPAVSATIPDDVVGSGLKVGGNGRVISLSCSSTAPVLANTQGGSLRMIIDEKKPAAPVAQGKGDDKSEGNRNDAILAKDAKRYSASSCFSTDSFFTSFTSPSQAPTPPPGKETISSEGSASSDRGSSSDSPTPTAMSPPGLKIITSSTTNSTRAHSPVDDVYTPSSSAMPTPLASSFPAVPPLPPAFSSLGEDLKTVSRILSATRSQNRETKVADEPDDCHCNWTDGEASRLSCASNMSAQTLVPDEQMSLGIPADTRFHSYSETERDTESLYSDSFYSARSSFEG